MGLTTEKEWLTETKEQILSECRNGVQEVVQKLETQRDAKMQALRVREAVHNIRREAFEREVQECDAMEKNVTA